MSQTPEREEELFSRARALPPHERSLLLGRECAGDPALRARVEALLAADAAATGFLEPPPAEAGRPAGAAAALRPPTAEEQPGDRIGRYKLLQKIGEGGCGAVWMAEQEEPLRRRVALKVIKLGMDTKEVIARFESERQALALMDHPNIAHVYDAGTTAAGRPYFVMELVRGTKITAYCDEHVLSTAARLDLFIQVCHAVQHAHQKGIIHRDLKPSNILVTLQDGAATPKVIDFGIAKATQGRLTDRTLFTAFEQLVGTPAYMSPEQAELSNQDVDTRSDVYSLGVLLYELLTGQPPFDPRALVARGLDEMRRVIREVDPPKPSARLRTLERDTLTSTAQRRASEVPRLIHTLCGDLDWIVMRCLEKDRRRRYATADELARDLERHLHDEPVAARPPNSADRWQKFVRRHRMGAAVSLTIATALVVLAAITTNLYMRERRAREAAVAAKAAAGTEAEKSRQVAQLLTDMLQGVGPSVALGRDTTLLHEILHRATVRLDQPGPPPPEVEAAIRRTIGRVYFEMGLYHDAETMLRRALALTQRVLNEPAVVQARSELGHTLGAAYKLEEAESLLTEALTAQRRLLGPDDLELARTLFRFGDLRHAQRRNEDAIAFYREALAIRERVSGNANLDVVATQLALGRLVARTGGSAEGERLIRSALAARRSELGGQHPDVADALWQLGVALNRQLRRAEAEEVLREALAIQRAQLGAFHPKIAGTLFELAQALRSREAGGERERCLREALEIHRKLGAKGYSEMSGILQELARVHAEAGRMADAERCVRESLDLIRQNLGEDHPFHSQAQNHLVDYIAAQPGRIAEAEAMQRDALARLKRIGQDGTPTAASALVQLGMLLDQQERWGDAADAYRQARDLQRPWRNDALRAVAPLVGLARVLHRGGETGEALRALEEAEACAGESPESGALSSAVARSRIAAAYCVVGSYARGVEIGRGALETLRSSADSSSAAAIEVLQALADAHDGLGQSEAALALCREAHTVALQRLGPVGPRTEQTAQRLGLALLENGALTESQELLERVVAMRRDRLGTTHISLANPLAALGRLYCERGEFIVAEATIREALRLARAGGDDDAHRSLWTCWLGWAVAGQGRAEEAEALFNSSGDGVLRSWRGFSGGDRRQAERAIERIVQFFNAQGRAVLGVEWQKRLATQQESVTERTERSAAGGPAR